MRMEQNEIKTRSIRADNDSFEKFKLISEEFPNQAQALAALISVYEVEQSKALLPERQTEIESFSALMQKINEIYNHSLMLNHNAEIRIRAEFERKLTSKDSIIQDLQDKAKSAALQTQTAEEQRKALLKYSETDKKQITLLEKELSAYQSEKLKNDEIISSLTAITAEYKSADTENKKLKSENAELQKQIVELNYNIKSLSAETDQAGTRMKEAAAEHEQRISFLIEKAELEKGRKLLELKQDYENKIDELKADHSKRIEEYQKKIDDLLNVKEQEIEIKPEPTAVKPQAKRRTKKSADTSETTP